MKDRENIGKRISRSGIHKKDFSQQLISMKKGEVMYSNKQDKDITSYCVRYKIEGIKTQRLICFNARNSSIEKITKIIKE